MSNPNPNPNPNNRRMFMYVINALFLVVVAILLAEIFQKIEFAQNCSSYLKGAASANNVELALDRLEPAINFLEQTGRTEGYSNLIIRTEEANVRFWYQNILAAKYDLEKAAHMKLRETLLDDSRENSRITMPSHIVWFPNQIAWSLGMLFSLL